MIGNDTARRNFCVDVRRDSPAMFNTATSDSATYSTLLRNDDLVYSHKLSKSSLKRQHTNKIYSSIMHMYTSANPVSLSAN